MSIEPEELYMAYYILEAVEDFLKDAKKDGGIYVPIRSIEKVIEDKADELS